MNRKALTALVAGLVLVAAATDATAETHLVPKDFTTIQGAIEAAADGDTIIVKKGKYAEQLRIESRKDLRLIGKGKPEVGAGSGNGVEISNCVGIVFQGFGVDLAEGFGILIQSSTDVTVTKCVIANTGDDGIRADACAMITVSKCRLDDIGDDGIAFSEGLGTIKTNDSVIEKCTIRECSDDAVDINGNDNEVIKCRAFDVGEDGFELDEDAGGTGNLFERCSATNCEEDGFLVGSGSFGNTLIKCKAVNCEDDWIDVEGSDNRIERCRAVACDDDGFDIDGSGNDFLRNQAIRCSDDGYEVDGLNNHFEKNVSRSASENGFQIDSAATGNAFTGNKASKSGDRDMEDNSQHGMNMFDRNKFRKVAT